MMEITETSFLNSDTDKNSKNLNYSTISIVQEKKVSTDLSFEKELAEAFTNAKSKEEFIISQEFDKLYNPKLVYAIFIVIFLSNILINVDHGTLPGCRD